jgi:hypothetical protein
MGLTQNRRRGKPPFPAVLAVLPHTDLQSVRVSVEGSEFFSDHRLRGLQ